MSTNYYPLNQSQQVINLQTTLTLFKRVGNILFSLTFDEPLDRPTMERALNLAFERIDSLRIRIVRKGGRKMQYFDTKRTPGRIGSVELNSQSDLERFVKRFRRNMVNPAKGETLKAVFAKDPSGKDMLFVKISHFAADTYGIGIIVDDLMGVYRALKNGTELPAAPGPFEPVLKKDDEFLSNRDLLEKDREFFEDFYTVRHPQHPTYCGLHGNNCDFWLKHKRKGHFSIPFLFIKCDTEGYRYVIPSSVVDKAIAWCERENVTIANFFLYAYCLACSLRNDRAPYQQPLVLLNSRATTVEKKCAGTKVQATGLYAEVDYNRSFNDNIKAMVAQQTETYRHTRMSYVDVQGIQHKVWGHSALTQVDNFSYSFIPFKAPEGVKFQVYSNGKGALAAYVALMFDPDTREIQAVYDVQRIMTTARELTEFQNTLVSVIEKVLARPESKLNDII